MTARSVASLTLALVLILANASPIAAWDPETERATSGSAAPPGLYYVTDIYVGDIVTRSGATTTYGTATLNTSPGTYARILETVATGRGSAYDGSAFNGRTTLSDGRAVAGTYYENFVRTVGGFVPVSVVFFQDDAETRAATRPTPTPPPPARTAQPTVARATARPTPRVLATPRRPTPAPTRTPRRSTRTQRPAERSQVTPSPAPTPPPPLIRVGLAPRPQGDALATIEVLRGRRVELWPRGWVDGAPALVRDWRLVSGELVVLGPLSGTGDEPLVARWDRLAAGGWPLGLRVTVLGRSGPVDLTAEVTVIVRAPALVE